MPSVVKQLEGKIPEKRKQKETVYTPSPDANTRNPFNFKIDPTCKPDGWPSQCSCLRSGVHVMQGSKQHSENTPERF